MSTTTAPLIENFQELELKKPADLIIGQIRDLISSGVLKPGDRLPSERAFADRFGVGRGHVREALRKLEFYGILKTVPHSGTFVASLGVKAIEGLIVNILDFEKRDLDSLLETRNILEINAARLAAERASRSDIAELTKLHEEFSKQVSNQDTGLAEDHLFHLKIAECSKNTLLRSLITLITPDIIAVANEKNTCIDGRAGDALIEHERILEAIKRKDPDLAESAMEAHFEMALQRFKS